MRRLKRAALFLNMLTLGIIVPVMARADWIINGQPSLFIPFWYTLDEMLCRYMISYC